MGGRRKEFLTIPYAPRPLQREIHDTRTRFNVLVCHRRFGKTVLCINELIRGALTCKRPNPRFAYVAPLYRQAKQVAWDYLQHYTAVVPGRMVNQAELRVDMPTGARVSLYGADNPDALRGIYLDGVVLDEYAQMSPRVWGEILRPTLVDRAGWAIFIGTPMGHNAFYDIYQSAKNFPDWMARIFPASETGIVPADELERARATMSPEQYDQEFECSWSAAILGAYYGRLITEAEQAGRIGPVSYDPAVKVETWWDLGYTDSTAIWFAQRVGAEVHLIDYYEASSEPLGHYVALLQRYSTERRYVYGDHVFPHDVRAKELGTGKSREELLQSLGVKLLVAPQHHVQDGIEAARTLIPRCWFDAEHCKPGLEALRQYRRDWDDRRRTFRDDPLHDWTSHAADAFRIGAMHKPTSGALKPITYPSMGFL